MGVTPFRRRGDEIDPVSRGDVTMCLRGVDAERSGRSVLRGVDLDVVSGEVLALVGPNGAGKSTLLAVLAGDLESAAGSAQLHGRSLTQWSATRAARRRAVLPQQHTVGFSFTADQVVRMGRSPWQGTARADEDDEAVSAALEQCDVTAFAHRPFVSLSGGERAR
ncbi:MAG: ATP-binding cassette domain-containing protein, partial [Rhodococcus sp. (in: high G+C Gram-positive bacteria)]